MRKELRSIVGFCAGVVLLWLACLGAASAYVRGSISPWFNVGGTQYDFGWKANILVDTSTGTCLSPSSPLSGITSICTDATLLSATGALFRPYPGTQIYPTPAGSSFDFTSTPSLFDDISVYFDGGTVVGINTGPIGYFTLPANTLYDPVNPSPSPSVPLSAQNMWVELLYAPVLGVQTGNLLLQAADVELRKVCGEEENSHENEHGEDEDDDGDGDRSSCTYLPTSENYLAGLASGSDITLSVVPEPGSIALICGALLAAGFIRRRPQLR
ncbi:MAG: PEP-CTERM sorting domain-containing protein [Casimicrobiaceae bacterium]